MIYALRAVSSLRSRASTKCIASLVQKRFLKLEPIPAASTEIVENFEEKNARMKRPLSPHLTIYKLPLPAMLSITHRITGCMLVGQIILAALACRYSSVTELIDFINSLGLTYNQWLACKALFIYPYMFHLCNGFRHLVWDIGLFLSLKGVYTSSYIVLVSSVICTIASILYFQ